MIHYAVAFGLLLHVLFWGAGLAVLAMPRRWRAFWPVLAAPAGIALQMLVVWLGAWVDLPGTKAYAWWSEIVPVGLIALAGWRRRDKKPSPASGLLQVEVGRWGGVLLASAALLAAMVWPLAQASKGLTTISLGSCDAADYAAGARTLQEFARSERGGFLGQAEVVRTMSVDSFPDYWLRLNHFGPAAIVALNGSVLGCAPHEITSLATMMLLATTLPLVSWAARTLLRHRSRTSGAIAGLFALSPLAWYAVAHVAMGQLIAAQAIALLTWAGVALWRGRLGWQFAGVLAIGYGLLLASYNFMLVVALVPAVAFAGGLALWRGQLRRLAEWALLMIAPAGAMALVFFERTAGLVERFRLLQSFDFGWPIPVITPEGWIGFLAGTDLGGWPAAVRWTLSIVLVALVGWALVRRRRQAWLAASVTLPVLAGYAFLAGRGEMLGTNASYDAYKLLFVFLPVMLPVFCAWGSLRAGAIVVVVALAASAAAAGGFMRELRDRALIVDGGLRQLRKIEAMADVKSVNVLVPDMWSRLWANYFLLRKEQFFATDTYEARWHTALRGEWDLAGGILAVKSPGDGRRVIAPGLVLVDNRGPRTLRVEFGRGWHQEEQAGRTGERWRWTSGEATLRLTNRLSRPLTVAITLDGWSHGEREVSIVDVDGRESARVRLGATRTTVRFEAVTVRPGESGFRLRSGAPATVPPGETRALAVCVLGIEVEVAN